MKYMLKLYSTTALVISLINIVIHLFVYPYLPETIPYHWNIAGKVTDTGSKYMDLILAFLPFLLYILLLVIPKLDPKREAYLKHIKAYSVFTLVIVTFMSLVTIMVMIASFGYPVKIPVVMGILLGILFLFIGNYMGQIRPNFLFGVRTPWTLSSEQNWRKTHRLAGPMFASVGLYMLIGAFFNNSFVSISGIFLILIVVVVLYVYSYLAYQKENKR